MFEIVSSSLIYSIWVPVSQVSVGSQVSEMSLVSFLVAV